MQMTLDTNLLRALMSSNFKENAGGAQGFFEANILQTLEFVEGATTKGGSFPTYIIDGIQKAIRWSPPASAPSLKTLTASTFQMCQTRF